MGASTKAIMLKRKGSAPAGPARPLKKNKSVSRMPTVLLHSKRSVTALTLDTSSRTLHVDGLDNIAFGTGANERERNTINIKSVTISAAVQNTLTDRVIFRWAIIMPKVDQTGGSTATNFFKGYAGENGLDFTTTRSGNQLIHYPINPAVHEVLAQGKIGLAGASYNAGLEPREIDMFKNIPINRKFVYDSSATSTPYNRLLFVSWWDDAFSATTDPSTTGIVSQLSFITHFHDSV